jgi:cytochrome P450 family 110
MRELPPGPSRPALLQTLAWIRRPLELLDDCRRRFGHRFTLRFVGDRDYVLISRVDDVKAFFQMPPEAFASAQANMRPFVGEYSLFVLDGERHRRHRRLIGPPLRGERLHAYARLIGELTEAEVRSWPEGREFPIVASMRDLTLRLIVRAVFGIRADESTRRATELIHGLTSGPTALLAFIPALHRDLGPRSPWGRFLRLREQLSSLLADEIERARRDAAGREDILAKLTQEGLAEGDPLSDEEIIGELLTLLAAGHETSTATLAWAFQWILADPVLEDRLTAEIRAAWSGGPLSHAALEQMPLLEATVLETLRMVPIVPIVPRLCARELTLGDLTVPAGTYLTACAYLTQNDPEVHADPQVFRPERFLGRRPSPFELYPFGGGHRHCIGAAFALYEVRAILAAVLGRTRLARSDRRPQRIGRSGITVTPAQGTPVRLLARTA